MVRAADVLPAEPGIEGTIQSQIDAFLVDDFVTAFTFASPNIQGMFGSPERFGSMVRSGYPMVWRPGEVRFLELRDVGGQLWQKVMIRDQQGQLHVLDYQMVQSEGLWKINGVQVLRAPGVGA
ncbi:MAG: DUF4864 domain-containing protein [Paracoccaceae bacterium]|nr:DUF4864 domain-containing protein [Paracoccaceae bacterium]